MIKYYGWYDSNPSLEGTLALGYWNYVVNEYALEGKDQNDLVRYTKEHYVRACRNYMDKLTENSPNRKFFIDIPLAEVYFDGSRIAEDGYEENIPIWKTLDWIEYVVNELESDGRVLGWYHADEPEVWGYREIVNGNVVNTNPKVPYTFLQERYLHIKSISDKPVLTVFCDIPLFLDRYYSHIISYTPFFDIFGFDYYPFTPTNKTINSKKFEEFINISSNIDSKMPILFVGQGSGGTEFSNRVPFIQEHQALAMEFFKHCPKERRFGYLLWSANPRYANQSAIQNGTLALRFLHEWELSADRLKNIKIKNSFKDYIKRLFRL